jgi:hypothetical protein
MSVYNYIFNRIKGSNTVEAIISIETNPMAVPPESEIGGWCITYCQIPSSSVEEIIIDDPEQTTVTIELKKKKSYEITVCRLDLNGNQVGDKVVETIDVPE